MNAKQGDYKCGDQINTLPNTHGCYDDLCMEKKRVNSCIARGPFGAIISMKIAFQILAAFLTAPPSNFPAKAEESSRFVSVSCSPEAFVWHQENKNTSSKSQRDVSLLKKKKFSRFTVRDEKCCS